MIGNPFPLKANAKKSFQGSIVLGKGFVLELEDAQALILKDARNREVLFPYLNGDDLNNDPEQKPSRWVINFFDWPEERARTYPDCFEIVERLVKSERMQQNDKGGKEKWWQFLRPRNELYETISQLDQVMVLTRVSKYVVVEMVNSKQVFMEKIVVKTFQNPFYFGLLQSNIYNEWAWKYSSTLGSGTINYSPSVCFDTFPFPQITTNKHLIDVATSFYSWRKKIMQETGLGLTKLYNQFHNSLLIDIEDPNVENLIFQKKYGKDSLYLKKHLKDHKNLTYNDVVDKIKVLRDYQIKMDKVVLEIYGWTDVSLQHDFYEIDYLSESDRIRFSIHPNARREILKRLLKLNKEIALKELEQRQLNIDHNQVILDEPLNKSSQTLFDI